MENDKLKFNLSPSSLNQYIESELVYFYYYIQKSEIDTLTPDAYGNGGVLVHKILEDYLRSNIDVMLQFEQMWKSYNMDNGRTFGAPLSKSDYMKAVRNGVNLLNWKYNIEQTESTITFPLYDSEKATIKLKGILDCRGTLIDNKRRVILDWKTSSSVDTDDKFKRQGLFYVLLDKLEFEKLHPYEKYEIPLMCFEYIKIDEYKEYDFTLDEIEDFHKFLYSKAEEIAEKGRDISKYDIGDIDSPFNAHKQKCYNVLKTREQVDKNKIVFNLKYFRNVIQIRNSLSPVLVNALKKAFSYEVQNAYYIQQNSNWDGIQRLYNERDQSVALGFRDRLIRVLELFAKHKNMECSFQFFDSRFTKPVESNDFPEKLIGIDLRDYQVEAVDKFLESKIGILQLPTSAGKSEIAFECIRRLKLRTLFIINRKELMYQTAERMEKVFGFKVGVIGDGVCETDKWVTVSTVQSLVSRKDELRQFFENIQFAICDETHNVATKTFREVFKMLISTSHRLGISATARREDLNDMLIEEGVGNIIYDLDASVLVDAGFIMKPTIYFEHMEGSKDNYLTYPDDYRINIVDNEIRNERIVSIAQEYKNKKVLILTKNVEHGAILNSLISKFMTSFHLHGSVPSEERKTNFDNFKNSTSGCMVATMSIASEGINLPNLDIIINAGANKGDIKSIQILGRVLRVFEGKKEAIYWDFIDSGKYTKLHSRARFNALKEQGHNIKIHEVEKHED